MNPRIDRDRYRAASWRRYVGGEREPAPLPPGFLDEVRERLAGLDDDDDVTLELRAGVLRQIVEHLQPEPASSYERGAEVHDEEAGVTYRATIGRDRGRRWLRTVEVIPDDIAAPEQRVFRVPTNVVAALVAEVHAAEAGEARTDAELRMTFGDSSVVFGVRHAPPEPSSVPTAEQLARLMHDGLNRREIAGYFGRSVNTVDQWLRRARREQPDLFPERTRGPAPQTTE